MLVVFFKIFFWNDDITYRTINNYLTQNSNRQRVRWVEWQQYRRTKVCPNCLAHPHPEQGIIVFRWVLMSLLRYAGRWQGVHGGRTAGFRRNFEQILQGATCKSSRKTVRPNGTSRRFACTIGVHRLKFQLNP